MMLQYFRHSKKYFSQEGEDVLIKEYFLNRSTGFYVDIGAHHPYRNNNTYLLYKKGWRGINIDPIPGFLKKFKKARRHDTNLEIGISNEPHIMSYYMFSNSELNSFDEKLVDFRKGLQNVRYMGKKYIEMDTLSNVLNKYSVEKVDFLNIDVEGFEYSVLKSNDWHKIAPQLICLEKYVKQIEDIFNLQEYIFLKKHGYLLVSKLHNSLIFLHKSAEFLKVTGPGRFYG